MGPKLKARFGSENIQDRNCSGRDYGIERQNYTTKIYGIGRPIIEIAGFLGKLVEITGSNGPDVLEIPRGITNTFLLLYCVTFWRFAK